MPEGFTPDFLAKDLARQGEMAKRFLTEAESALEKGHFEIAEESFRQCMDAVTAAYALSSEFARLAREARLRGTRALASGSAEEPSFGKGFLERVKKAGKNLLTAGEPEPLREEVEPCPNCLKIECECPAPRNAA